MHIHLNGREIEITQEVVTYQEIVNLADSGRSKQALHSIVYSTRRKGDTRRSGMIAPGEELKLEDGMVITALVTDNA